MSKITEKDLIADIAVASFMDNTIAANRGLGKTFVPSIIVLVGSCFIFSVGQLPPLPK